mmetsp:Transcript_40222/g.125154  ORF Transcript_40222/g.125154 Transcript_40222/m.125154 type:complete len:132 (+) Transcript_40222:66-461(+)
MSSAGQSSRTPFDHLRHSYPSTWKRLVKIMEESGAPVVARPPVDSSGSPMRTSGGFRLEGSHAGPALVDVRPPSRSKSDPAILRWREEEKRQLHTLRPMKNTRRNPFGGWYEGATSIEKIGGASSKVHQEF